MATISSRIRFIVNIIKNITAWDNVSNHRSFSTFIGSINKTLCCKSESLLDDYSNKASKAPLHIMYLQ